MSNDSVFTHLLMQQKGRQLRPNFSSGTSTSNNGSRGFHGFVHGSTSIAMQVDAEQQNGQRRKADDLLRNWDISATLSNEKAGDVYVCYKESYPNKNYEQLSKNDHPLYFDYMLKTLIGRNNGNLGCYVRPYLVRFKANGVENNHSTDMLVHLKNTIAQDLDNNHGFYSVGLENCPSVDASFTWKKLEPFIWLPGQTMQFKYFNPFFHKQHYTSDWLFPENHAEQNQLVIQMVLWDILGLPIHDKTRREANETGGPANGDYDYNEEAGVGLGYWTLDVIEEDVIKIRKPILGETDSEIQKSSLQYMWTIPVAEQEFMPAVNPDVTTFKN